MAKSKASTAKGAGGTKKEAPKAVAKKTTVFSIQAKTAKQKHLHVARLKANKARSAKSNERKADEGVQCLGVTNHNMNQSYITTWVDDRPYIVSFLADIMRNGSVEDNYRKSLNQVQTASSEPQLSMRCFGMNATKWKS